MTSSEAKTRLVCFDFVTHFGGAQRCCLSLCQALSDFAEVTVVDAYGSCRQYVEALQSAGIPLHVLMPNAQHTYIGVRDRPGLRLYRALRQAPELFRLRRRLIETILRLDPDVIWTNGSKPLVFLVTSRPLRRYPCVFWAQGWYRRCQVPRVARWAIRRADRVVAVSNGTRQALESWGVREQRLQVFFNVIDEKAALTDSRRETTAPLSDRQSLYKILVPGLLVRTKGQHTAIEAARLLKREMVEFVMWIAGDAQPGDETGYGKHLAELISRYGLGDDVFLLGYRDDVGSLMRLADVVVLPTHTEGFPRVIQEAMIVGCPVISTPVGGVTDLIADSETGLLMPVDDPEALARNLERLMRDKHLAKTIRENARRQMSERFTWERHLDVARSTLLRVQKANTEEFDYARSR